MFPVPVQPAASAIDQDTQIRGVFTPISALVRELPSDADVAQTLVERSGHTPAEVEAFNAAFRRKNFNFVLLEADEGRLRPGLKASVLKFLYNSAVMPIFYPLFRRDERNRTATAGSPSAT